VSIVGRAFDPPSVEVTMGGTVEWTNEDVDGHTVTGDDGSFDSGIIAPGESFTRAFDAPGTYGYFCAIHPDMVGTVSVSGTAGASGTPSPSASAAPASG
jgi:plastocyanin